MDNIAVGVIDCLRKNVKGILVDKWKQRTACRRMNFILGDNSHLIIRVIDLIAGLAIQPIQVFFRVFEFSSLLKSVTEFIDRQIECGKRIFSDNDLPCRLPSRDECAEIKLIWPKILQLLNQQVLVSCADRGINLLILITDTKFDTAVVKLKEEIVLVLLVSST